MLAHHSDAIFTAPKTPITRPLRQGSETIPLVKMIPTCGNCLHDAELETVHRVGGGTSGGVEISNELAFWFSDK